MSTSPPAPKPGSPPRLERSDSFPHSHPLVSLRPPRLFTNTVRDSAPPETLAPVIPTPHDHIPLYDVQNLSENEIKAFVDELDHNRDGWIDYAELEGQLDRVHAELAPKALPHHLHHESRDDAARHEFLRHILGTTAPKIRREEFEARVRDWEIPSLEQEKAEEVAEKAYMRRMGYWRRFRSWWSVHGPTVLFVALVVATELAFGVWQFVKYLTGPYRAALGWGVVLSKTCAGFIAPTMFFLILSMSRYFSTFLRRSYHISRFINWDLSQTFHIRMSILVIILGTLHGIGHLAGSFVYGSMPSRQAALGALIGEENVPMTYHDWIASRPGWTGLAVLAMFYILAGLSMPQVRRWSYEVFQLGHLLMFPIIALLCVHGTKQFLQFAMLGYFLAFPTLLVILERSWRFIVGFHGIDATVRELDAETVEVSCAIPREKIWQYNAGQYIFLQVPSISRWQWHPFTISSCDGENVMLHIKTDGNWTSMLRGKVGEKGVGKIIIGLDGPFGAPAQRFYDFSHTILVGSGIGVTPFSGILTDLQRKDDVEHGGPEDGCGRLARKRSRSMSLRRWRSRSASQSRSQTPRRRRSPSESGGATPVDDNDGESLSRQASRLGRALARIIPAGRYAMDYRRVDFHWMVRDRNHLLWFSDLLNDISRSQNWHAKKDETSHLDIRIHTHVTQKRSNIATHVYRWLLEKHRTKEQPHSPLTGLINPTHFGRPDFIRILDAHYEDMKRYVVETGATDEKLKVGVFFCGAPVIGEILADRCRLLTARGANEGCDVRYIFMTEVFN